MMTDRIHFGSKELSYSVFFSERKTLGIIVHPDMNIEVRAPEQTGIEEIRKKVLKRAPWIIKQQHFFQTFHPKMPEKKFISGETHLYLGRQYLLKVKVGKKDEVRYKGRGIEITTRKKANAKQLLTDWYRIKAKEKFAIIAEPLIERFKKYNVEPAGIYIQEMKLRWGSCSPKGRIILNVELIKAPRPCIEYVIIHELCHLIHHNHTQKFLELQSKEMPDREKWKTKLEKVLG